MSYYTDQTLFDSKQYFFDEKLTCWMACLMSWTKCTPFDTSSQECDEGAISERFQEIMQHRKWQRDDQFDQCRSCSTAFGLWNRKHHCRLCGDIFCDECSPNRNIKCCYRDNLIMRACQPCFDIFTERWSLFHSLQRRWMKSEGKLSDCFLPSHPDFETTHLRINESLDNKLFQKKFKSKTNGSDTSSGSDNNSKSLENRGDDSEGTFNQPILVFDKDTLRNKYRGRQRVIRGGTVLPAFLMLIIFISVVAYHLTMVNWIDQLSP